MLKYIYRSIWYTVDINELKKIRHLNKTLSGFNSTNIYLIKKNNNDYSQDNIPRGVSE